MTKQTRRKFSGAFKAKVALEAIKNQKTLSELSQQFEVNAVTISKWKSEFLENMALVFEHGQSGKPSDSQADLETLYAQIGQLKVENDFLKKSARKLGIPEKEWKP
jgi:transposase-like protein